MRGLSPLFLSLCLGVMLAGPNQCETKESVGVVCSSDQTRSCTCPGDNDWGIQYCNIEGNRWGACDCSSPFDQPSEPLSIN